MTKKKDKLTVKEEKYVRALVETGNGTEAIIQAGYNVTSRESARSLSATKRAQPKIQNAIAKLMLKKYPETEMATVDAMHELITAPIKMADGDEGISAADRLKAIQYMHKLLGHEPATKTAHIRVNANTNGLPLPGYAEEIVDITPSEEGDDNEPQ
jgi:phage terminase small subunit